ncbi:MAG: DsbA family protein [Minisyncoccia bacterium]
MTTETTSDSSNGKFLPIAVVVGCLFIAGAVLWNGSHSSGSGAAAQGGTQQGTQPTVAVNIKDVKTDGNPFIGQASAPVTIAEWSDYQCPFCKEFEITTLPQIVQDYVAAGKVKIVFKDFPFLGPDSMVDAEYARAVWALYPAQFGAWRTALFSQEPQENSLSAADNLTFVNKVTGSVSGISLSAVKAAVAANQTAYDTAINADKNEAANFGISATPSFVIGTQMIAGAYPYANFKTAIDALLK